MSTLSLPSYTHPDIPSYTAQPRGGEQTLGLASRARRVDLSDRSSNWEKKFGHATLTLTAQSSDSEFPVYGRGATIHGFVTLDSTQDVASVTLKVLSFNQ